MLVGCGAGREEDVGKTAVGETLEGDQSGGVEGWVSPPAEEEPLGPRVGSAGQGPCLGAGGRCPRAWRALPCSPRAVPWRCALALRLCPL